MSASAAADEARREGKSNVCTYTSGKRGVVVRSDIFASALLGNVTGRLGTAGREGTLTSNEQDIRGTPSWTYLHTLSFAIRVKLRLSITAIQR